MVAGRLLVALLTAVVATHLVIVGGNSNSGYSDENATNSRPTTRSLADDWVLWNETTIAEADASTTAIINSTSSSGSNIVDGSTVDGVGGRPNSTKYPFFAVSNGATFCGATLIWPDVLVSAAHCTGAFFANNAVAYIGGTTLRPRNAPNPAIPISRLVVYPFYTEANRNDILLLFLNRTSPAPYATWNEDARLPRLGQSATVIGHGTTARNDNVLSNSLKEATVKIVSSQLCHLVYRSSDAVDEFFCATKQSGMAYFGDSGGPLLDTDSLVNAQQRAVILGIVSFGTGRTRGGRTLLAPNGYTRISSYSNWIWATICQFSQVPPPSQNNATLCASAIAAVPTSINDLATPKSCRVPQGNTGTTANSSTTGTNQTVVKSSFACRKWLGLVPGWRLYRTNFVPRRTCQTRCIVGAQNVQRHLKRGWQCGAC